MIKVKNIKYDKSRGIITANAECDGDGVWYSITVDTKVWEAWGNNDNTPGVILGKCRNKFREMVSLNRKIPSKLAIMWY